MDTRRTVQGIDLETGVVGETVLLEEIPDSAGLLDRVAAQSVAGFGQIAGETFCSGGEHLERRPENGLGLFLFMGIVGGKDNIHRSCFEQVKIQIKLLLLHVICSLR